MRFVDGLVPPLLVLLGLCPARAGARSTPPPEGDPLWTEIRHGERSDRSEAGGPLPAPSIPKLARTVGPAVVNVSTLQREEGEPGTLFGKPRTRGQGTGFIIHRSGYVVTNHHVIDGADEIKVRLADDREFAAELVGSDERTDIALLRIAVPGELPVVPLGDSDRIEIGEWVVAIGNPFGLDHTVTAGIVSGKGRRDVRPGGSPTGFYDFIQTDASINVGNSGGPLLNTRGEVVGMNTAMNANAQGIAFAIPINMVKAIVPLLRERGRAPRSWLGLLSQPVTASLQRAFGLPDMHGALVAEVLAGSPAEASGLQPGDVVLEFDGRPIRRADDLQWLVATSRPGRHVGLAVRRKDTVLRLETTMRVDPDDPVPSPVESAPRGHVSPLGIAVSEITPSMARELGLPDARGVVVVQVEPGSPASEVGLERGDLLVRIGERPIEQLDDYGRAVRGLPAGAMIRLLARRSGRSFWVAFAKR
jgi:serine protease Do